MNKQDEAERNSNLLAGGIFLGVLAAIVLAIVVVVVIRQAQPEPPHYIIYVKNAGTLRTGSPVYLNGRRIGRVEDVELLNRDGGVQARVDFSFLRAYEHLKFPVDSRVSVSGPGLTSGPSLVLNYGSKGTLIENGGEYKQAESASNVDQVTSMAEQARSITATLDELQNTIGDPAISENIRNSLAQVRETMNTLNTRAEELRPRFVQVKNELDGRPAQLADLRKQFIAQTADVGDRLQKLDEALADGNASLDEVQQRSAEASAELRRYLRTSEQLLTQSKDPHLRGLALQARWQAAALAAQLDRARSDPSTAGDAPRAQQVREHFNGGKHALDRFGGDTDINKFD